MSWSTPIYCLDSCSYTTPTTPTLYVSLFTFSYYLCYPYPLYTTSTPTPVPPLLLLPYSTFLPQRRPVRLSDSTSSFPSSKRRNSWSKLAYVHEQREFTHRGQIVAAWHRSPLNTTPATPTLLFFFLHHPLAAWITIARKVCSADGSTHTESNKLYRKVKHRYRPNLSPRQRPTAKARHDQTALAASAEARGATHRARPRSPSRTRPPSRARR